MGSLRTSEAFRPPAEPGTTVRHRGFSTFRPANTPDTTRLWIDDLDQLRQVEARAALAQSLAAATAEDGRAQVDIIGVQQGDDLIDAAILALYLHFKSPQTPVCIFADRRSINTQVYRLFEGAMGKPALLLKTLDHVIFARLHYLVGQQDHRRIAALAAQLGFIERCADGDRRIAHRLARLLDVQKRNLQLMSTRRCQLRCVYCPVEKRDADLSLADAQRAIAILLNSSNRRFRVDFAGGEPLLRKPWIRQLIETTHQQAQRANKQDSYYLVTNGIELSDDFCHFLSGYDVELEISIDGSESSHNRNKIAVDGQLNPYRTLIRNCEHLRKHAIRYNAVLVFTPETFASLHEDLEHILALGFRNIAINYAIGYLWDDGLIAQYVDLLAHFVARTDMLAKGDEAPCFIKNLRYKAEPTVLNSELMVDTDGSLHLLSEWQFAKALRRGQPPFSYALDDLESIDEVFFTKAQVYHLLYQVYRDDKKDTLGLIHNSVETGLQVSRRLREAFGAPARPRKG
jgi:organic radical activating enzyme